LLATKLTTFPERSGKVTIPVKAFHAVLGGQEVKRKSG
jgi:hypothetical protein